MWIIGDNTCSEGPLFCGRKKSWLGRQHAVRALEIETERRKEQLDIFVLWRQASTDHVVRVRHTLEALTWPAHAEKGTSPMTSCARPCAPRHAAQHAAAEETEGQRGDRAKRADREPIEKDFSAIQAASRPVISARFRPAGFSKCRCEYPHWDRKARQTSKTHESSRAGTLVRGSKTDEIAPWLPSAMRRHGGPSRDSQTLVISP